jgi:DNA ligase-1
MPVCFNSVCRTLETVASISGANAKIAVLRSADSPLLQEVLIRAYSPMLTYGITSKTALLTHAAKASGGGHETLFTLLDRLATRALSGNNALMALADVMTLHTEQEHGVILGILDKHLDCGISTGTINKAFPGLIPEPPVMLAQTFEPHRAKYPMLAQVKYDGMRVFCEVKETGVIKRSRNWHEQPKYPHINDALDKFSDDSGITGYFDGELMYPRFGDRSNEKAVCLVIYDYLTVAEFLNRKTQSQISRTTRLALMLNKYPNPKLLPAESRIVYTYEEALEFYNEVVGAGGEGIMLKDMEAPYAFKRSYAWLKLKPIRDIDLMITGVFEGEGKYTGMLGGVIVDYNGKSVRVGSGFTDGDRVSFWRFPGWSPSDIGDYLLGKTAEVRFTEETPDGSLLFPRFVRIREDK